MISIEPIPFVIQLASFFLLWAALKRLLFDPVSAVLAERERRTIGVRADAEAAREQVEVASADYDRRIQEVRRTVAAERDSERSGTSGEEREIVAQAHDQAAALLSKERESLQAQTTAASATLDGRADELAALMLERVAGRKFA